MKKTSSERSRKADQNWKLHIHVSYTSRKAIGATSSEGFSDSSFVNFSSLVPCIWRTICVFVFATQTVQILSTFRQTRHKASTSMYSLTFCVRVMSPERHHWKPAVQATAVMLRTPPVTRRSPASSERTPRRAFAL